MELGQRLLQARREAGLSQRQLCGDKISRNMLSQIENGSARPSMDTLRYFAQRLGKPMGYFLEEQAVTSPNQEVMAKARQVRGTQVLEILKDYREDDQVFDRERWLLEAIACLEAAREALRQEKAGLARTLLERCAQAGDRTPYYTESLERERLLLCYQADKADAQILEQLLPENTWEMLLRAHAALDASQPEQARNLLLAASGHNDRWYWLMGQTGIALRNYEEAARALERIAEPTMHVYAALERCYKELEDYKMAYFYACKQKNRNDAEIM